VCVVGLGYVDAVRNLEVTFRSLGGGSKEKMQEDWESIDFVGIHHQTQSIMCWYSRVQACNMDKQR